MLAFFTRKWLDPVIGGTNEQKGQVKNKRDSKEQKGTQKEEGGKEEWGRRGEKRKVTLKAKEKHKNKVDKWRKKDL